MKTDFFQSCSHCWVFQICWHIECSTITASSSRIWKSSTGIPSPPLALFIVMLSKAHLTSHSKMSGSRWVITPFWLSGSWRSFLYSSSVYSCHLFCVHNLFCMSLSPYGCGGFVAKSCPTLATPSAVVCQVLCPQDFPDKNTRVGCYFLLQGIILTQELNLSLLHCR